MLTGKDIAEIVATGTPISALVGGLVLVNTRRLKRIEAAISALAKHSHPTPHCKPPVLPPDAVLVALLASASLLAGCAGVGLSLRLGLDLPGTTNGPPSVLTNSLTSTPMSR
jgi:hypothetical protein